MRYLFSVSRNRTRSAGSLLFVFAVTWSARTMTLAASLIATGDVEFIFVTLLYLFPVCSCDG